MKRKLSIFLAFVLVVMCSVVFTVIALAEGEGDEGTITISYMNTQDTTSDTTSLDTGAYSDGKQEVVAGEKFTLPTTSSNTYAGKEGFQLVWYTEDGRTYKAGEEVSFDKDTKLFRAVSKECYTMAEVNYAMCNESTSAILMADISTNSGISVQGQGQSVLILNGFTINIEKNGSNIMGAQRSGKHIYGEGTINVNNPDGKQGSYYFFNMQSHGYNGHLNKQVIGRDVTINAPNYYLGADSDGSYNNHYPWLRIYGTVNCYGFLNIGSGNRAPFVEVFDTANVTVNGPRLFWDITSSKVNNQAFELRIYGGTFNLPAEAATEAFWSNDNVESVTTADGKNTYPNVGLNKNNKDQIRIFGGTFNVAGDVAPAIDSYLTDDYIGSIPSGGNGLVANKDKSTYHVCYMNRPGYKLVFEKYTEGTPAKLTVTDYVDGSLSGTYYYTSVAGTIEGTTTATIDRITVYEDAEGTVVTSKFKLGFGMSGAVLFSNATTRTNYMITSYEGTYFVAPAGCSHSYVKTGEKASCQTQGYVTYICKICGFSATVITEEKTDHAYTVVEHIEATASTIGSKTFECGDCGETIVRPYTVDPSDLQIEVTIRKDDGSFEKITVAASEIFDFAKTGVEGTYTYTVSAIKAFGDYKVRNIYGITIPKGIFYINITTHNYEKYSNVEYGLVELTVEEGANVTFMNIGNLRKVEKIIIEEDTNVTFSPNCSYYNPSNEKRNMQKIATFDLSAGNHTVNFLGSAFSERTTVANLILGENSTYNFGTYCFNKCAITEFTFSVTNEYKFDSYCFYGNDMTELVFPDNFDVTLGNSTFENCNLLESITFGENSKYEFGNYAFLYGAMTKVTLAPYSTYIIGQQVFPNSVLTELDMSAGNMEVTMNSSAFSFWLSNKHYSDSFTTVKFGGNSTYVIGENCFNSTNITELVLADNSSYTFKKNSAAGDANKATLALIDASAYNITVVFEGESFRDRTSLTTLDISGNNSSYHFYGSSFYNTKVSELVMGEGSTYVFEGNCFNNNTPMARIDARANGVNVEFKQNAFNGKSAIAELLINGENATYTFGQESFKGVAVKALTLGQGSTYTFARYTFANCKVESLDATASNVTATFNNEAFKNMSALTYFAIGENSTYVFGDYSFEAISATNPIVFSNTSTFTIGKRAFYKAHFESIKFEDDVNVTFTGVEAFEEGIGTKELYLGRNFQLDNYPFKRLRDLEKLTIMEGVKFKDDQTEDWFFEYYGCRDYSTPVVVYNHSYDLVFTKGMFHECDGIFLYTVTENIGTRTDVFSNCGDNGGFKAWTVILGIPHALEQGASEPTCTVIGGTNWVATDCDCGIVYREDLSINVYEKKHNITETTEPTRVDSYTISPIPVLGHLKGDFVTIVYPNGYISAGSVCYNCERCGNAEGYYEELALPLIQNLGYSVSEFGEAKSMVQGFSVNSEAIQAYKAVCPSFTYGIVAYINAAGQEVSPLTVTEGSITANTTGVVFSALADINNYVNVRISGITDKTKETCFVLCTFIYDGSKIEYVDNGTISESVVGTTYSNIAAN